MTKPLAPEPTAPLTITNDDLYGALNLYRGGLFLNPETGTVLPFAPVGMALARGLVLIVDGEEIRHLVATEGAARAAARLTAEVRAYVAAVAR